MKPLTIFVAMPGSSLGEHATWTDIDEIKEHLYDRLGVMVAEQLGREVDVVIEKDKDTVGLIHSSMFTEAMQAEVYIADLTGANANVYLELGVRWALRDHVTVPVCQNVAHDVKFNVAANRVIPYGKNPGELKGALRKISSAITKGLQQQLVDSPVRSNVDTVPVSRDELDTLNEQLAELQKARGDDLLNAALNATVHQHRTDLLRRLIEVNPNRADAYGELGTSLIKAGQDIEAAEALRQATKLDPQDARWWRALGVAHSRHGDLDAAVEALQRAVTLDDQDSEAYANLGGAHRRRARNTDHRVESLRQAREAYWRASQLDKHDLYPLTNIRRLDVLLADSPEARTSALEEFRKLRTLAEYVVDTEPDQWRRLDYAETLAFSGDSAAAGEALRIGLFEFEPDHRTQTAQTAVEPVRDMLEVGWLPDNVAEALRGLVQEYEKAAQ
ncbi:tetratricopeptide repeat-containing protein [Saccharothrix longispora]|uniref:tetratricopeptide repeat-containing protein n=1 Tax=Saccharothrix longispora TaxID=33920 RepID=UPI0028FD8872|nr:tetratricopeptide repeat-containing protein [Saccharothrix longispora]MDU0294385.1 tetratricopeptide repeat-containing protein [Saccharothrix longispora]